jgi:hypothetical protein
LLPYLDKPDMDRMEIVTHYLRTWVLLLVRRL